MEHVVYILGAGFSAPLGLPVVRNFLLKAKDLYFADSKRYAHFEAVFRRIETMAVAKNYFDADLFDIEEVLSILEMDSQVGADDPEIPFKDFVRDVISHYTPELRPPQRDVLNWAPSAFGQSHWSSHYGYFVAELSAVRLAKEQSATGERFLCQPFDNPEVRYGVITLNYDTVLESVWSYLRRHYVVEADRAFAVNELVEKGDRTRLAKLHGSIDGPDIVPPTWSKSLYEQIVPAWRTAFNLLQAANHIRFIGYSLPTTDSYVRYLLKAGLAKARHLKSIDVLCQDPSGQVKARYDNFITFNYYKFRNDTTEHYLAANLHNAVAGNGASHVPGRLEQSHNEAFV